MPEIDLVDIIERKADQMAGVLIEATKKEWRDQGKVSSGKALRTIGQRSRVTSRSIIREILVEDYMEYQDRGVKPENIPFTLGSGATSSLVVKGVMNWIRKNLSVPEAERLGVAFAIIQSWKANRGMPSEGSVAFSSNGRVLNWSRHSIEIATPDMDRIIESPEFLEAAVDNVILEVNQNLST